MLTYLKIEISPSTATIGTYLVPYLKQGALGLCIKSFVVNSREFFLRSGNITFQIFYAYYNMFLWVVYISKYSEYTLYCSIKVLPTPNSPAS